MDIVSLQNRKFITTAHPEAIKALKGESLHATLSRRFLELSAQKTEAILRSTDTLLKRYRRVFEVVYFFPFLLPFVALLSLFLPEEAADFLLGNETQTRALVGWTFGLTIVIALFPTSLFLYPITGRRSLDACLKALLTLTFLLVCATVSVSPGLIPGRYFSFLLGSSAKRNLFLSVVVFVSSFPFLLAFSALKGFLARRIGLLQSFDPHFRVQKELAKAMQMALNEIGQANEAELEQLIKEYAPGQYRSILEALRVKEPLIGTIIPNPTQEKPDAPKEYKLPLYLGVTEAGDHLTVDLASLPHLLVGGATGGGKSNFMSHLVSSLLPQEVELVLIDPEQVELIDFAGKPNVRFVDKVDDAKVLVQEQLDYMHQARDFFAEHRVKNIDDYNDLPAVEKIKRKVIVVDEFSIFAKDKKFTKELIEVATKGRKWGVHLVIATQRPSNRVVHEEIRANIPATIAFAVRDKKNSSILNVRGAETIGIDQKGLAIFAHGAKQLFVQTPLYKPKEGKWEGKVEPVEQLPPRLSLPAPAPLDRALDLLRENKGWIPFTKIAKSISYAGEPSALARLLSTQEGVIKRRINGKSQYCYSKRKK